jgi:hypothetical protein
MIPRFPLREFSTGRFEEGKRFFRRRGVGDGGVGSELLTVASCGDGDATWSGVSGGLVEPKAVEGFQVSKSPGRL